MATNDTTIRRIQQKAKKTKMDTKEKWETFNQMMTNKCKTEIQDIKNTDTFQRTIVECMNATVGSVIVNDNQKVNICNLQIQEAKVNRKCDKYNFDKAQACKHKSNNRNQLRAKHIDSQKSVR
jgi:hypothetical protein